MLLKVTASEWTASEGQNKAWRPGVLFPDPHSHMRSGRVLRNRYLAIVNDRQLDAGEQILHDGIEEWHVH